MNRDRLLDTLTRDEGLRLGPYNDTEGIPTIGIGRNLRDIGWNGKKYASIDAFLADYPNGITAEDARDALDYDVQEAIEGAQDLAGKDWGFLSSIQKEVIVNLVFNLGKHGLSKFKGVWRNVGNANYPMAAVEMLDSRWATQVKRRSARLSIAFATNDEAALELG